VLGKKPVKKSIRRICGILSGAMLPQPSWKANHGEENHDKRPQNGGYYHGAGDVVERGRVHVAAAMQ